MDLRDKYIKSLERTIELQEGFIKVQNEHIEDLKAKIKSIESELTLEKLKKATPTINPFPGTVKWPENPWEPYTTWSGTFPEVNAKYNGEEEKTQKGSSA